MLYSLKFLETTQTPLLAVFADDVPPFPALEFLTFVILLFMLCWLHKNVWM